MSHVINVGKQFHFKYITIQYISFLHNIRTSYVNVISCYCVVFVRPDRVCVPGSVSMWNDSEDVQPGAQDLLPLLFQLLWLWGESQLDESEKHSVFIYSAISSHCDTCSHFTLQEGLSHAVAIHCQISLQYLASVIFVAHYFCILCSA